MAVELKIESISDGIEVKQEELVNENEEPIYSTYYQIIEYESQNTVVSPKEESIDVEDDNLFQTIPQQTAQCIQCNNEFTNNTLVVENRCSKCNLVRNNDESDISGKTFSNETDPKEDKSNNLQCKSCNQIFITKTDLRDHLSFQCESRLGCPDCGQVFERNWILKRHMRHHFNEKQRAIKKKIIQLICNHCNAQFANPMLLQTHYYKRGFECGFICVRCGRLFKLSKGLHRHISTKKCESMFKEVANESKKDSPLGKIVKPIDFIECPFTRQKTSPAIKPVTQQKPKYKAFQYQSILNNAQSESLQKGTNFASILHDMAPDLSSNDTKNQHLLETTPQVRPTLKRRSNLPENHLNNVDYKDISGQHKAIINGFSKVKVVQNNVNPEPQVHLPPIFPTQNEENVVVSSNTIATEQPVTRTAPPQQTIPKSTTHTALTEPRILNCKAQSTIIAPKLLVRKNTSDVAARVQNTTKATLQTIPQPDVAKSTIIAPKLPVRKTTKPILQTTLQPDLAQSTIIAPKLLVRKNTCDVDARVQNTTKATLQTTPQPELAKSTIIAPKLLVRKNTSDVDARVQNTTKATLQTKPQPDVAESTIIAPKLLVRKNTSDVDARVQNTTKATLKTKPQPDVAQSTIIAPKLLVRKNTSDVDARVQNTTKATLQTTPQPDVEQSTIRASKLLVRKNASDVDARVQNTTKATLQTTPQPDVAESTIIAPKLLVRKNTSDVDARVQNTTKATLKTKPQPDVAQSTIIAPKLLVRKNTSDVDARVQNTTKATLQTTPQPDVAQSTIIAPKLLVRKNTSDVDSRVQNTIKPILQTTPQPELAKSKIIAPKLLVKKNTSDVDARVQTTKPILQTTPQLDLASNDYTKTQPTLEPTPQIISTLNRRSNLVKKHLNTIVYQRILVQRKFNLNGYGKAKVLQINVNLEPQVQLSAIVPNEKEENIVISSKPIATEQPVIQTAHKVLTEPRILNCKATSAVIAPKLLVRNSATHVDARAKNTTKPIPQAQPQREIISKPITFGNAESKKIANTVSTERVLLNWKPRSTIPAPKKLIKKHTINIDSTLQKITKPLGPTLPRCVIIPKAVTTSNVQSKKLKLKDFIDQHLIKCKARSTINAPKFLIRKQSMKPLPQTAPQEINIPKPMTIPSVELKKPPFKDSKEQLILNTKAGSTINAPKIRIKKPIDINSTVQDTTEIIPHLVITPIQDAPKPITFDNVESKKPETKDCRRQLLVNCKTPSPIKDPELLGRNQSVDVDAAIQKSTQTTDFEDVITTNHIILEGTEHLLNIDSAQRSSEETEDFEQMIVVNFLPKNQMQNNPTENNTDENYSVLSDKLDHQKHLLNK